MRNEENVENVENVYIQFARLTKPLARHLERFRISLTDDRVYESKQRVHKRKLDVIIKELS